MQRSSNATAAPSGEGGEENKLPLTGRNLEPDHFLLKLIWKKEEYKGGV